MRRALHGRDVEVTTISGRGDHAVDFPRVSGRRPLDFSLFINRHTSLLGDSGADVVHALGGPGGVLLTRKLRQPLVYTANHTYRQAYSRFSPRRGLGLGRLEAAAYKRAQKVLAISPSTADAVIATGVDPAKVEVLAPGVDLPDEAGVERDPKLVLFVGRLEEVKGVFEVLRIVQALQHRVPDVHAVMVGTGANEQELRRRVEVSGAPVEVAGRLADAEVYKLYARAALVLMPSKYEGLGLVAAEAIVRGTPVVGYDVDGLRDIVTPSGGGLLVKAGSMIALSEAAWVRLASRDEAAAVKAQEWIAANHSWETVGKRLAEVYSTLV